MNSRRVLVASLLLNAALGVLAWQLARVELPVARTVAHSSLPSRVRRLPPDPVVRVRTPAPAPANAVATAGVAMAAFHWSKIESDDYERYVANLRAIGCPEQTLRDIIFADVYELYMNQIRNVLRPVWENCWDILAGGADEHPVFKSVDKQMDKLNDERKELLEKLLGTRDREISTPQPPTSHIAATLADELPPERKQQLDEIEARFQRLMESIGEKDKDTDRKLAEFRKQRDAEQLALLTPDERAEWHRRQSRIASQRHSMNSTLTEEELRAVASIQADAGKANEDSAQVNDRIRGVIGDERFTDYSRSEDNEYRALVQVGRRLELPTASVIQADDIRRAAQNKLSLLMEGNFEFSESDKVAARAAILRETSQALGATLGEQGLKAYRRNGGVWLDQIAKP